MNFMGKSTGDSGSSTSSRRQQQGGGGGGGGGNLFEEEDEEERQNTAPAGQLFPSSSSSSPSSSHHQHQHQHQPPPSFLHQPPYHHQNQRGGWVFDGTSSRPSDPMVMDYSSVAQPAPDNINDDDQQSSHQAAAGGGGMMMVVEREHMFDKVVTPSDVGKLNRLVIPKQHAERYFPLDSSTNDKGLLLNFEDRNGKPWRFRYSYWNSSQSYVMTKGWSRFVKDKKLDAGDIVSFQRGVGGSAKDRLFIDWRHRPDAQAPPYQLSSNLSFPLPHHQFSFHNRNTAGVSWNPLFFQSQPAPPRSHSNLMLQPPNSYAAPPNSYRYGSSGGSPYHNIGTGSVVNVNQGGSGSSVIYFRSGAGGIPHQQHADMMQMQQRSGVGVGVGIGIDPPALPGPAPGVVFESVPVVHGKAAAKRLRLFGVNMDCPISDDDEQDYDQLPGELISPTTNSIPMGHYNHGDYHHEHYPTHHNPPPPPSSSSSTIPYLQLRPNYGEETQFHQTTMVSSSSVDAFNKSTKSSSSHMSLDLDI
ncbi:B3 domain-containing protein Os03g0120900 [Lactuca sativa]|uniref:TF-B3 domain-containing protein n=1 Tax=Lactuca sativa TaxID=4236 RepID=A0A9R1XSH1_LACSA|nr:B3 domain-containing protein Os03g0120900 [Lactuca sativa]KAJ0217757.1 hypothetical protein LSAT_V11C300106940 [Lactuca sativa]